MQLLTRLVILLSVLLMPFGMSAGLATTGSAQAAEMPMNHCGDQAPRHGTKGDGAECTLACTATLPAADSAKSAAPVVICEPILPAVAQRLHGLHPEAATPPPRPS